MVASGAARVQCLLKDGRAATFRLAVPDDAASITDLVNTAGAEKRWVLRERATWSLEEERKTLGAADGTRSTFFVAVVDDRLSGLLNISRGLWPKNAHVAEFGMACLPDSRRIGLGTALVQRALDWSRSVGVRKVNLEVFSINTPAIGLYRKMGFTEEGRRHGEFEIDGVPMTLWL